MAPSMRSRWDHWPARRGRRYSVLGQGDLQTAFGGAGALGEDVKDEGGAVDDLDVQSGFQGALLGRGQVRRRR